MHYKYAIVLVTFFLSFSSFCFSQKNDTDTSRTHKVKLHLPSTVNRVHNLFSINSNYFIQLDRNKTSLHIYNKGNGEFIKSFPFYDNSDIEEIIKVDDFNTILINSQNTYKLTIDNTNSIVLNKLQIGDVDFPLYHRLNAYRENFDLNENYKVEQTYPILKVIHKKTNNLLHSLDGYVINRFDNNIFLISPKSGQYELRDLLQNKVISTLNLPYIDRNEVEFIETKNHYIINWKHIDNNYFISKKDFSISSIDGRRSPAHLYIYNEKQELIAKKDTIYIIYDIETLEPKDTISMFKSETFRILNDKHYIIQSKYCQGFQIFDFSTKQSISPLIPFSLSKADQNGVLCLIRDDNNYSLIDVSNLKLLKNYGLSEAHELQAKKAISNDNVFINNESTIFLIDNFSGEIKTIDILRSKGYLDSSAELNYLAKDLLVSCNDEDRYIFNFHNQTTSRISNYSISYYTSNEIVRQEFNDLIYIKEDSINQINLYSKEKNVLKVFPNKNYSDDYTFNKAGTKFISTARQQGYDLEIYDLNNKGELIFALNTEYSIHDAQLNENEDKIAIISRYLIEVWDLKTKQRIVKLKSLTERNNAFTDRNGYFGNFFDWNKKKEFSCGFLTEDFTDIKYITTKYKVEFSSKTKDKVLLLNTNADLEIYDLNAFNLIESFQNIHWFNLSEDKSRVFLLTRDHFYKVIDLKSLQTISTIKLYKDGSWLNFNSNSEFNGDSKTRSELFFIDGTNEKYYCNDLKNSLENKNLFYEDLRKKRINTENTQWLETTCENKNNTIVENSIELRESTFAALNHIFDSTPIHISYGTENLKGLEWKNIPIKNIHGQFQKLRSGILREGSFMYISYDPEIFSLGNDRKNKDSLVTVRIASTNNMFDVIKFENTKTDRFSNEELISLIKNLDPLMHFDFDVITPNGISGTFKQLNINTEKAKANLETLCPVFFNVMFRESYSSYYPLVFGYAGFHWIKIIDTDKY